MASLAALLAGLGLCIIPSPGDGHCLLHSFVTSYNRQINGATNINLDTVIEMLSSEALQNAHEYIHFTESSETSFITDLIVYIENRRYQQDFCDLVPKMLSNVFSVIIIIIDEARDSVQQVTFIPDKLTTACPTLYMHRKIDHYNGLRNVCSLVSPSRVICYSSDELHGYNDSTHTPITRSTRKRLFHLHLWRPQTPESPPIQTKQNASRKHVTNVNSVFALMNARSVRNKVDDIKDYIAENHVDVLAITESHLRSDDDVVVGELTPPGYSLTHVPRASRSGGGVAIIHHEEIKAHILNSETKYHTFEALEVTLSCENTSLRMVVIYRPPRSTINAVTINDFIEEFVDMATEHLLSKCPLLFVGDFNIHVDNATDNAACHFLHQLSSCGLVQHVDEATHEKGHTLDLIITRESEAIVSDINIHAMLSDHYAILFDVAFRKPHDVPRCVTYRDLKKVDMKAFEEDIQSHNFVNMSDLEPLVVEYDNVLNAALEKYAPLKTKSFKTTRLSPWYTDEIRDAKRVRRQLERKWRKSKSLDSKAAYLAQRRLVSNMMSSARTNHFSTLVNDNCQNPRNLFRIIDALLHRNKKSRFPPSDSNVTLANMFSDFFIEKVKTIKDSLDGCVQNDSEADVDTGEGIPLDSFSVVDIGDLKKTILHSKSTSCELDPVPTPFLKACINTLLPVLAQIINLSLTSGIMPSPLKQAVIHPLLKKILLELILVNYRPVSNLPFLSKIIERCVAKQLLFHQRVNGFEEKLQSAYKEGHSTETALVRVQNDLLVALDARKIAILLLLDMSAAFDTIDHSILLRRLEKQYLISGVALKWFRSYFTQRMQYVVVEGAKSENRNLECGVPQGSVLGPILFSMYIAPLGHIANKYGVSYHLYADDIQMYILFEPSTEALETTTTLLENCVNEINVWLQNNFLKLNEAKTELLLVGQKSRLSNIPPARLNIKTHTVEPSSSVRDLGVVFDSTLAMTDHVSNTVRSCFYHLRNLSRIRPCLTDTALVTAIHAFVTSRLDYCNALLSGVPLKLVSRLQRVQNAAAKLVKRARKFDHVSPLLQQLHWLPIKNRIVFKILCLTFKALHNGTPSYLADILEYYHPSRNLRSSHHKLLSIPHTNLKNAGERSFAHTAPSLWNGLPLELRVMDNYSSFKRKLKTHLFKQSY